jgi:hypothetical protein
LKSPRNATGIDMTNLHRSSPVNQSKTDLGIVNESQLPRFGITHSMISGFQYSPGGLMGHRAFFVYGSEKLLRRRRSLLAAESRLRIPNRKAVLTPNKSIPAIDSIPPNNFHLSRRLIPSSPDVVMAPAFDRRSHRSRHTRLRLSSEVVVPWDGSRGAMARTKSGPLWLFARPAAERDGLSVQRRSPTRPNADSQD